MRHIPHVYVPQPWDPEVIPLIGQQVRHLERVLRLEEGASLSYTDGVGRVGEGALGAGSIVRGTEVDVPAPAPEVSVAVAPPRKQERVRFLVEKLAELGVDRLVWLATRLGEGRAPRAEKADAWARSALEQSRGAWLLRISGPISPAALPGTPTLWVAERETEMPPSVVEGGILVIGPEAGFAEGEIPASANRIGLGRRILRVETAAVVGATVMLERTGRLSW